MLVAQELNRREHPIYGVYVVGKLWHFMVLQQQEYVISKGFLADDEQIFDIFALLKALKVILLDIAKQDVGGASFPSIISAPGSLNNVFFY